MIKEIDPTRPYITWYTDNGLENKDTKEKVVSVERICQVWVVEWWDHKTNRGGNWMRFNTYPTRKEAEAAAEIVFLTQPWR